jgi:hypothetical protein
MLHDDRPTSRFPLRAARRLLAGLLVAWALALGGTLPAHAMTVIPAPSHGAPGALHVDLGAASTPATAVPPIEAAGTPTPTPSPSPAPSGSGSGSTGDPILRGIIFMLIFATIGLIGMRYIERRILRS